MLTPTMRQHHDTFIDGGTFSTCEAWLFAALMVAGRRLSGPDLKQWFIENSVDYRLVRPFSPRSQELQPDYEWGYQF